MRWSQHDLCKSVCAHLERKVHAKSLNCIGTVHRGERSVFTCWCVVKLEKNLYQVRTGVKQRITTRCELTAQGQRASAYTWYCGHAPFLVNGGSYCWKMPSMACGLISSDGFPKMYYLFLAYVLSIFNEKQNEMLGWISKLLFSIQWNWMLTVAIKQDCLWIMTSYESGPHTDIYCNMTS